MGSVGTKLLHILSGAKPTDVYGSTVGIEIHSSTLAIFDGGHLLPIPLQREKMEIFFIEPFDDRSWTVEFNGIWDEDTLQPRVELRTQADIDAGYKNTAYHEMTPKKYNLVELHREKGSIAWNISELRQGMQGPCDEKASFKVHQGDKAISDYLPMMTQGEYLDEECVKSDVAFPSCRDEVEIKITTNIMEMFDIYKYLTTLARSRDAEIPIISPVNVRVKAGKRIRVDLRALIRCCRHKEGEESIEYMRMSEFSPRPIFTRNGAITFDFDSTNVLSVYNATSCDFQIQKMGVITSLCNTRGVKVKAEKEYTWFSDDQVETPIIFRGLAHRQPHRTQAEKTVRRPATGRTDGKKKERIVKEKV